MGDLPSTPTSTFVAGGEGGNMITRAACTPSEWETIQFGPLWVTSAVAGADGVIDQDENASFSEEISRAAQLTSHRSPLWGEVTVSVAGDLEAVISRYTADSRAFDEGLGDVADILDEKQLSSDEAEEFKRALYALGVRIASASGGDPAATREAEQSMRSAGMPKEFAAMMAQGMGKIGSEEKLAMDQIQAALRLSQPVVV